MWRTETGEASLYHVVAVAHRGSESLIDPEIVWMRVFCHVILDHIPGEGLFEAWEALAAAKHFYSLPEPPRAIAAQSQALPARLGEPIERPPVQIDES